MPEFQPNFVVIDPVTGQLSFNFPGSVTLPVANAAEGDNPSKVHWQRTSDGAYLAEMYTWDDDTAGSHGATLNLRSFMQSETPAAGDYSIARLSAQGRPEVQPADFRAASIVPTWIDNGAGGGEAYVQAQASNSNLNSKVRRLIDTAGCSSFVQLDDLTGSEIVARWGVIDGTTGNTIGGGSGFTSSRTGAGVYRLDWNPAYVDHGAGIMDGAIGAIPLTTVAAHIVGSIGTGSFSIIRTFNAANAAADFTFAFVAIGNLES